MASEENTSTMAGRAGNFGYDAAKLEGTVRQRGSLRLGGPSRVRSHSSPADAALADAATAAEEAINGS
jgi:hypothetical protein